MLLPAQGQKLPQAVNVKLGPQTACVATASQRQWRSCEVSRAQ